MKASPTSCACVAIAVLIGGLFNQGLNAAPQYINGSISFTGNTSLNGSTVSATAVNSFTNITVVVGTNGIYAPLKNSHAASWLPFTFNPASIPVSPLWTCTSNGITYSFDASSMTVVFSSSNFLDLQGTGIAHVTGYADTPGFWTLAVQSIGASVNFTASTMVNATNVPVIQSYGMTNGNIGMSWNALPGQPYQLQTASNSDQLTWTDMGDVITTTNYSVSTNFPVGADSSRLFRVVVLPQ